MPMLLWKSMLELSITKRFRTLAGIDWTVPLFRATRVMTGEGAAASYATAGAQTYTAADVLSGTIVRDCAGAGRTDVLPTAALLVAAIKAANGGKAVVGDVLRLLLVNGTNGAFSVTVNAGAGGTFDANQAAASRVVQQNSSKVISIRITGILSGSEAYVVYC